MLEKEALGNELAEIQPMQLIVEVKRQFIEATKCCICNKPLDESRIRDHNHLTSEYRAAAHVGCIFNLNSLK